MEAHPTLKYQKLKGDKTCVELVVEVVVEVVVELVVEVPGCGAGCGGPWASAQLAQS